MRKIIPKCSECGSNKFYVGAKFKLVVEITNPRGRWADQVVEDDGLLEPPDVSCAECGKEPESEDMILVVRFIALNHVRQAEFVSMARKEVVIPWSHVRALQDMKKQDIVTDLIDPEGGDQ